VSSLSTNGKSRSDSYLLEERWLKTEQVQARRQLGGVQNRSRKIDGRPSKVGSEGEEALDHASG
jgi:hypothetical protein